MCLLLGWYLSSQFYNTSFFFSYPPLPTEFYTLSLHDALPICAGRLERLAALALFRGRAHTQRARRHRSEEHTSELQSRGHLVCRLLLEKKKHFAIATYTSNLLLRHVKTRQYMVGRNARVMASR